MRVWWDAHLSGGSTWRDTIESELNTASCVLVIWSKRSTAPEGSFVRDEANRALRRGVYLPVRIDLVEPPLGFGETQAQPLIGWKGDRLDPRYAEVLAAARAIVAGTPRVPAAAGPKTTRIAVDRRIVIGGGLAVIAAAAGGGIWKFNSTPGVAEDSVAVLPFANLSGDPAQAYFSDGMAEELRGALTRIDRLKVAGRISSELMRNADGPTAAAKLGVANILTGSVRRGAGTIRVTAELIDGSSGLSRWSQSYDRAAGDALAIETGIAENVANALNIALGRAEKALLTLGGTTSAAARDAYLRGQALRDKAENELALKEFDAAIAADPGYALAHAKRAGTITTIAGGSIGGAALRGKLAEAEAEARHAIALAPSLGVPLATLGSIQLARHDLRGGAYTEAYAYRAAPGDPAVLASYAQFQSIIGRHEEAIAAFRRALALDPLWPGQDGALGEILLRAGRLDEAIPKLRQSVMRVPNLPYARYALGIALLASRQFAEAKQSVDALSVDNWARQTIEAVATARLGDRGASDRALGELIRLHGSDAQYQIAEVHAQRGEMDAAFNALDQAWELGDTEFKEIKTDWLLVPLRADPRFAKWISKIGFS